jgi:hypothetical protein
MRMTDLKPGWPVVGNDGQRLATIREVGQHYVLASRDGFAGDLFVPASAIANVDDSVVYLNVTARAAGGMGWEQPPRDGDAPESATDEDLHRHV